MKFSERIGKTDIKSEIQLDYIDKQLENGLWSIISISILQPLKQEEWTKRSPYGNLISAIWFDLFKEPIDEIPIFTDRVEENLRQRFFSWNYLDQYNFIDFIASYDEGPLNKNKFIEACNHVLKRELSGYRFVDNQLAPITNEGEILQIEKAITDSADNHLKGVHIHLKEALRKLSDKQNPDYRNSIKESISAVESICQKITGDNNAELGKALKKLKETLPIHGALEQGFLKIYGYTSDSDGIRHAMMDESNLDQEDALYMMIACSSFINYLITKSTKTGILLK